MWIKDGQIFELHSEVRSHCTGTSFPAVMTDEMVVEAGYAPITPVAPVYNPATQMAVQIAPELVDGVYMQRWAVADMTPEQIRARVPQQVTMRQARLALHSAGLLTQVDAAIASLTEPAKTATKIEWEYAQTVDRASGLVPQMAAALGMTEAQIDDLFRLGATL